MIKLIAIDMDGTLLQSDHTISQRTKDVIRQTREKGVQIVICTGRPYPGVTKYIEELNLTDDYVISYNGALVQHTGSGEILVEETLGMEDLACVDQTAKALGIHFHASDNEFLYVLTDTISEHSHYESNLVHIPIKQCKYEELPAETRFNKIMYVDDAELLDRLIDSLPAEMYEQYTLMRSNPVFFEVVHKNASKGNAVRQLADQLHLAVDEVMCIGDNENDRDMIEFAGVGVAMGNAIPAIKEVADIVTLDCDHDGVADVIERYVLQGAFN